MGEGLNSPQTQAGQVLLPHMVAAWGEALAPSALAMERDNVGLLVDAGAPVRRILCALDITQPVLTEALALDCDMIVAHHPVIYRPLRALSHADVVYRLAQKGVSALCLHTNLDTADGGVNDVLADVLGLVQVHPFGSGMGRMGVPAQPQTAQTFLQRCRAQFGAGVRCTSVPQGRAIRTVAVLGGSGGDEAEAAFAAGADAYVTGEAGHHHGVAAAQADKLLVAAGHFATERPVVSVLAQKLAQAFVQTEIVVSKADKDPFCAL